MGEVDIVTGSNVFAHNDHPEIILEASKDVLSKNGYLCLEVMYVGDLIETLQWDTLYHEHLTFYCLSSLQRLLNKYGFYVVDAEHVPMHGGSLRICACQNEFAPKRAGVDAILKYENEKGLTKLETYQDFASLSKRKISIVRDVFREISKHHSVWAYGAAGKATMWVNACEMNYLEAVVDASPLRAGKLMPGTHTPIVFPDQFKKTPPDYMLITAWNYADNIRANEKWFQGIWATPLPDLRFF
jgi:C-methyltransferase